MLRNDQFKRLGTRVVTCLALMTAAIGGSAAAPALAAPRSHWALRDYFSYVRNWC